jgi:zinc protease
MKYKGILIILMLVLVGGTWLFSQKDPDILKFKDIDFKPKNPGYEKIREGLNFYYIEDDEVPAVSVYIIIKTGKLDNPKEKAGLASLTVDLMKSGGTKDMTPEEMEEKIDFLGARIYAYSLNEYSRFNLWTLKKNFNDSWKLLTDMIINPRFDEKRLELEKMKELESIRRRWDRPITVGFTLFRELVYGKEFAEVRRTTSSGIKSISNADIQNFYKKFIKDQEIIIAFSGDFDKKEAINLVSKTFSGWQCKPAVKRDIPEVKLATAPGIYLINKEDMTQTVVSVGHLGINRLDPDNVEINVLNFIYGAGSFNSRIMREIRSNRGLAYMAFGSVGRGRDKGTFSNFCMTKNESVGEVITIMRDIMNDITKKPVTAEELELAKKYEKNSFVHLFDSPASVLLQKLINKLQGYPDNYLETYLKRIGKVDAGKVLEMARRTIHPDQLITLVVGKKEAIMDQLKSLTTGKVIELELPKE